MIKIFSIYKITNLINNKIYIGITKRNPKIRFNEHFSNKNELLYKAKEKYGNIPLIPTYTYNHDNLSSYVEKPVLGRCGNNVTIVKDNHSTKYDGVYGDCPTVIQNLVPELIIDNRKIIGCISV